MSKETYVCVHHIWSLRKKQNKNSENPNVCAYQYSVVAVVAANRNAETGERGVVLTPAPAVAARARERESERARAKEGREQARRRASEREREHARARERVRA